MLSPGALVVQSVILVICARRVSGTTNRTPNELQHFPIGIAEYSHECRIRNQMQIAKMQGRCDAESKLGIYRAMLAVDAEFARPAMLRFRFLHR